MKRMKMNKKRLAHKKKSPNLRKRFFRTIKSCKKWVDPLKSPKNTTQFLIENNSTPFFDEDEEDFELAYIPNPVLLFKGTENSQDEDSLNIKKMSSLSTRAESFPLEEQNLIVEPNYLY